MLVVAVVKKNCSTLMDRTYLDLKYCKTDSIALKHRFSNTLIKSIKTKNPEIRLLNSQQPQDDVYVYADKGRVSQVVYNLLDNAVKFTKAAEEGFYKIFLK